MYTGPTKKRGNVSSGDGKRPGRDDDPSGPLPPLLPYKVRKTRRKLGFRFEYRRGHLTGPAFPHEVRGVYVSRVDVTRENPDWMLGNISPRVYQWTGSRLRYQDIVNVLARAELYHGWVINRILQGYTGPRSGLSNMDRISYILYHIDTYEHTDPNFFFWLDDQLNPLPGRSGPDIDNSEWFDPEPEVGDFSGPRVTFADYGKSIR